MGENLVQNIIATLLGIYNIMLVQEGNHKFPSYSQNYYYIYPPCTNREISGRNLQGRIVGRFRGSGALGPATTSGHISITLSTLLFIPILPRRNTFASVTARNASSQAYILPRMQLAPHQTWRVAFCTTK